MADWTVNQHAQTLVHSDTRIGTDPTPLDTWRPENLHLSWELDNGLIVGNATWEIPRMWEFVESPVVMGHDFYVKRDDAVIMGGEIIDITQARLEDEFITVAGEDWMHYLKTRCWPYDAQLSYVNWPDGFRFRVLSSGEVGHIVTDLLETVRDLNINYPALPDATAPSYSLDYTVDADDTGVEIRYYLEGSDSSSLFEIVQGLAQMERSQGGFEAYMTTGKVFRLVYPDLAADGPLYTLGIDDIDDISYRNTGPIATHVLGVGAGSGGEKQGGVNKHFRANSATYRRRDTVADFGDVKNLDELESLTSQALSFDANPVHEVTVTFDPARVSGSWDTIPGSTVELTSIDLGWHVVDGPYKVVSMDVEVDNERNETMTLGMNRYYDVAGAAGLDDF